jgi:hypothetical protein
MKKPNHWGYWWAREIHDYPSWMLVMVEVDGSVWYGKVKFTQDDFNEWEEFTGNYENTSNH